MTENAKPEPRGWDEEYPAHDLWSIQKSLTPMNPEEERDAWRTTVKVLNGMCTVADGLCLDPLILALADAITRAREELERVEDKLSRPEGIPEDAPPRERVHPREDERLIRMLRRSDAFHTALWLIRKYAKTCRPGAIDDEVEVIKAANKEASEALQSYKEEVGVLD